MDGTVEFEGKAKRLLIVEDEYLIASDHAQILTAHGWEIAAMVGSVAKALNVIEREGGDIDGAILDIKLGEEWIDPVAEALKKRGIKFVFATAYSTRIPRQFADVPHCQKPCQAQHLSNLLTGLIGPPMERATV